MKNTTRPMCLLALSVLFFGVVSATTSVAAQRSTSPPDQQSPAQQHQPPEQGTRPAPDSQAQSDSTVFSGTIAKINDKYVLQDASGKSYDLDRQDLAKQFEGKQVRVKGTLDSDGKTIHVK